MNKGRLFFAIAILISLPLLVGTSQPAVADDGTLGCTDNLPCSKCVFIDLFDPAHTGNAPSGSSWTLPDINGGMGVTVGTLIDQQAYLITVTGTVSYWFKSLWDNNPIVGTPLPSPKYLSDAPGAPLPASQTKVGYDWHCYFAYPQAQGAPLLTVPAVYSLKRISLDGGANFMDLPELGGELCAQDHTYRYLVTGRGLQAYFKIADTGPTYDNYGKYKICVQAVCCDPATTDCKALLTSPVEAGPPAMTDSTFDPRLIGGFADR